jgi:hypothetical protein
LKLEPQLKKLSIFWHVSQEFSRVMQNLKKLSKFCKKNAGANESMQALTIYMDDISKTSEETS